MTQLPFEDMPGADANPRAAETTPVEKSRGRGDIRGALTVGELANLVKDVLAEGLPKAVRVAGEISNFTSRTHWFFSLKDAQATMRCVCFASSAKRVKFDPRDGMQVVATGRVDFFPGQGSLQLYVDKLEPVGVGALELQLRQRMEELRELGYFAAERKKSLPTIPGKVAVITSRTGAALQDVINTAHKRWAGCRLYLCDVHVQGAEAAPEIAAMIEAVGRAGPALGIEAIILTRGGGSIEDLWAFNERIVAEAIFNCPLPLVAAIGHETDTTIAELVADCRAATPTQAAMMLIPDRNALDEQVAQTRHRLALGMRRLWQQHKQHLESLARQPMFRKPELTLQPKQRHLAELQRRLQRALPQWAQRERQRLRVAAQRLLQTWPRRRQRDRQRLDALDRQLQAVSPKAVLERGYSLTLGADGKALRHVAQTRAGDRLTTVLADGRVRSVVEGETGSVAPAPLASPPSAPARARGRKGPALAEGPGLFG